MNDAVIGLDAVTMVVSGKCPKQIEQSASVQCSRIKAKAIEEEIVVNEGTVKQLEEMFREIRLQEV